MDLLRLNTWIDEELGLGPQPEAIREALLQLAAQLDPGQAQRAAQLLPWLAAIRRDTANPGFRQQGPEALAAAQREVQWTPDRQSLEPIRREIQLTRLADRPDQEFADALLDSTDQTVLLLDALRDGEATLTGRRLKALLPWLFDLRQPGPRSPEHEGSDAAPISRPLLDHLAERLLWRKLLPLESAQFLQSGPGLDPDRIQAAALCVGQIRQAGLLPCLRAALLHLDIAKARGNAIHNLAARDQMREGQAPGFATTGLLQRWSAFRGKPLVTRLCEELVAAHGLVGQHLRGETTAGMLQPWVDFVRDLDLAGLATELGTDLTTEDLRRAAFNLLVLVDLCDTASVREGLMTGALWSRFQAVHDRLWQASLDGQPLPSGQSLDSPATAAPGVPERLFDRLRRLRSDRIAAGEPTEHLRKLLESFEPPLLEHLDQLFRTCQLWYCERATAELTVEGQLRLLCLAMRRAELDPDLDQSKPYHVDFRPLMEQLWRDGKPDTYRVRLLEALLEPLSFEALLRTEEAVESLMPAGASRNELGTFTGRIGEDPSIAIRFEPSPEAHALLTLLSIYERKKPAAFHATLKSLCDLYGLRKDEYDRVNNEASYLTTMNAARSDKSRMLDYVRPGRIVEVGPGGGVVLDLMEERFPDSEIVGLDVSEMVVAALERKKTLENRRWRVVQGDAFELPDLFSDGVSSVVFCSILHEIYSYVPWPTADGKKAQFQHGSVAAMLVAAFRCLQPGGRIVIRDGVQPPDGWRIIRFKQPEGPSTLELYAKEFEGRPIQYEWLAPNIARMTAADAMEFLYTYTWGPDAFPYEVREQYGILTLDAYRQALVDWLRDAEPGFQPQLVEMAPELQSYLQPGYNDGLAHLIDLFEGADYDLANLRPVALPDSNCLLVVEKTPFPGANAFSVRPF